MASPPGVFQKSRKKSKTKFDLPPAPAATTFEASHDQPRGAPEPSRAEIKPETAKFEEKG